MLDSVIDVHGDDSLRRCSTEMETSGGRVARTAAFGVGAVAVTAAIISFSHVRSLALRADETELTSWLLPVSIDGAVVAAASVLLADSRAGRRSAPLAWMLLSLGIGASLAANIASAEPTATARAVAAWPPLALALGIELLAGLARRDDAVQADRPAASESSDDLVRPGQSAGSANGSRPAGLHAGGRSGTLPPNGAGNAVGPLARPVIDDSRAVDLIRALDTAAPGGRASRLQIQKQLGCGGSRAARLAALARHGSLDAVG